MDKGEKRARQTQAPGIMSLLKPYRALILLLLLMALLSNGVNLLLPRIIAHGIDTFTQGSFNRRSILIQFSLAILFVFVFTYLQSIIQTYASERVARDLRSRLAEKISGQPYSYIEKANPARLLTNLTADVDSIKLFISQAIVSIASSLFIIIGASVLLFMIRWQLANRWFPGSCKNASGRLSVRQKEASILLFFPLWSADYPFGFG